jgi:hypothetical protein
MGPENRRLIITRLEGAETRRGEPAPHTERQCATGATGCNLGQRSGDNLLVARPHSSAHQHVYSRCPLPAARHRCCRCNGASAPSRLGLVHAAGRCLGSQNFNLSLGLWSRVETAISAVVGRNARFRKDAFSERGGGLKCEFSPCFMPGNKKGGGRAESGIAAWWNQHASRYQQKWRRLENGLGLGFESSARNLEPLGRSLLPTTPVASSHKPWHPRPAGSLSKFPTAMEVSFWSRAGIPHALFGPRRRLPSRSDGGVDHAES